MMSISLISILVYKFNYLLYLSYFQSVSVSDKIIYNKDLNYF